MEFAHTSFFTSEPAEALAARLIEIAPPGFGAGRVAFVGSGSEAVETALKLARQYHVERGEPSRSVVIARRMSYHGNTLGALGVGGHPARRAIYEPMLAPGAFVSACHPFRNRGAGETDDAYTDRLADELRAKIAELGEQHIAAFIAEPISGATLGSVPPVPGYLAKMCKVCDAAGILFIADEIMCGIGRAGAWFVSADEGIAPDIITIAKGLGAGYQPIGAMMASEKVVDAVAAGTGMLANGHTYMSHAVACRAALEVLDTIADEGLLARARTLGDLLEKQLRARFGDHPNIGDIRGRGLFWSMELVTEREGNTPFPSTARLAATIKAQAMAGGLVCYPSSGTLDGHLGDHVLLAPPFICTSEQITEIVERLDGAIARALADIAMPA